MATFQQLAEDFKRNPDIFREQYENSFNLISSQDKESLSDYPDGNWVSTMAKDHARCEEFVRSRLVELLIDEWPLDAALNLVQIEAIKMTHWEDGKFFETLRLPINSSGGIDVVLSSSSSSSGEPDPRRRLKPDSDSDPKSGPGEPRMAPSPSLPPSDPSLYLGQQERPPKATKSHQRTAHSPPKQRAMRSPKPSTIIQRPASSSSLPSSSLSSSSSSSTPKVPQQHRGQLARQGNVRIFHNDWFWRGSLRIVQRLLYIASIALFFSSIPSFLAANTTYSTTNELGPLHIPLNEPISSAYHNAVNLSLIGLSMLSCSQRLKYSHHSLLGAGAIVRVSDINRREELAANYDRLKYVTRELSDVLYQYDLEVNSLIKSLETNLGISVEQFTEVLRKLHLVQTSRAAAAVWGVTAIPAALCVGLVFTAPLSPAAAAGCIGAFTAFTQGSCYMHAFAFAANNPATALASPICMPLYLLGIGQPSAAATQELLLQGDRIAAEFTAFILITEHHINLLFGLSAAGFSGAKEAEKLYTAISELRFRGENRVKAAHTPGWRARFSWGKTKGLSEPESLYNASLPVQLRNLSELEHAYTDALSYFRASEPLLKTVGLSFRDLGEAVVAFRARTSSTREWHRIAAEIELLRPLIKELEELGNYHGDQRRQVVRSWKDRWEFCIQNRWKDWADCVFEGGLSGEGAG